MRASRLPGIALACVLPSLVACDDYFVSVREFAWSCDDSLAVGDSVVMLADRGPASLFSTAESYSSDHPGRAWRFRWSVDDRAVATIDGRGMLVARAPGFVTVRAAEGDESGEHTFRVVGTTLVATMTPATVDLAVGDSAMLRGTMRDANGDPPADGGDHSFRFVPGMLVSPGPVAFHGYGHSGLPSDSMRVVAQQPGTTLLRWCAAPHVGSVPIRVR